MTRHIVRSPARVLLLCAVISAAPVLLSAQEARGTITGIVLDPSKGVLPRASVTITNVAMGTNVELATNEVGFFEAPYLIPGTYRITVEMAGFKKYVRDNVEVRVGDRLELELPLELGGAQEEVTVVAETPLLQTTNASLGEVVDLRRVAELPTPHGDPFALIGLAAGVSFRGSPRLDRPFEPTHIVGYSMNGTRSNRSDITIDGVPATSTANAGEVIASFVPPQDLVQEFRVQTATFDAGFGNTEGGVTNLSLKSGTNQLHGTGYIVKTPASLLANDFFANANDIPLPDFRYTRWSATAGGPIVLPGVYNGRQRTFFMYGYESIPEARPRNNGTPTVPSERMRNGDFSELLALGPQYQIYNPFTRRAIAGGRFQQDPFPNNIIPPHLINPVARAILEYLPLPRTQGNAAGIGNYQRPELKEETEYGSHTIRVDHVISQKQRMYGRVSWYDRNSNYNNYFDNLATGEWFKFISRQAALDHVYTFNATTFLNLRYGYDRFLRGIDANPASHGFDLTSLGFPASYNSAIPQAIRRFPRIAFAPYQGTAIGGEDRPTETQSFIATLTKTKGSHSLRTGMELRRYRETDVFFGNDLTGTFNFDSTWTRGPLDNSATAPQSAGQSFAAFLLGLPSSGSVNRPAEYDERSTTWGVYLQDDWRVGGRLTVNLGLRYEVETPLMERLNRSVRGFDFDAVQPMEAAARAALNPTATGVPRDQFAVRGGLTFPGVNGQPEGLYETPKGNVMPRVGFAYELDDRTVLSAGYGMFYGFLGQRRGDVIQSGFSATTSLVPTLDNGLTFIETLSTPFQGGITEPVGAALGAQTFLGQSITFFDSDPVSPRNQRWQVGIQRSIGRDWVAEANYVGNYGSQLQTSRNLNATPQQYLSTQGVRDQATIDYLSAQVPNPFFGLMPSTAGAAFRGANIARERLLRPYPHFDAVNTTTNEGYSWYHSLRVGMKRRFSAGYMVAANYTFSRFTQATEFLNAADADPTEVISDQDSPHRVSISGIWELPFGHGRRFGADVHPVVSKMISGWQVSGIYAYQSGTPLGFGNVLFTGNLDDIALPAGERTVEQWFNVDAGFNRVAAQQLASNVRTFPLRLGSVRSDPVNNVDLSLIKNTRLAGEAVLQLRFEALNAFNHPLLPGPSTDPLAVAFGSIIASTQVNYSRRVQLMAKIIF
jgi:hypothetical protein